MAVFVVPPALEAELGQDVVRSDAPDVASLLAEVRLRLSAERQALLERGALLVNGRSIHRLRGLDTPLAPEDQVWLVFPAAGG
jgi:molybdopterin converting factor small subunit